MSDIITRCNELENLELHLEHDSGYITNSAEAKRYLVEMNEMASLEKLILCSVAIEGWDDFSYLYVEPDYSENLSPGQKELYGLLLSLQENSTYTLTTIERLTQRMSLTWSLATEKRLENLQAVGAVRGYLE